MTTPTTPPAGRPDVPATASLPDSAHSQASPAVLAGPRSYLYVPGDRPERLEKAIGRGADAVIADLEDAVTPDHKRLALDHIDAWLQTLEAGSTQIWVRVNDPDQRTAEISRLARHHQITGFVLPKVDQPSDVSRVAEQLQAAGSPAFLAPMIESARGLVAIHAIAGEPRVYQLHLGEMDLAADLDLDPNVDDALLHARSLIVVASRAAGLPAPPAPVSAEINDAATYTDQTRYLAALGFHGRDCIHPRQVQIATAVFSPNDADLAWAKEVLDMASTAHGAFRDSTGQMVDEAILRRAREMLAHASG